MTPAAYAAEVRAERLEILREQPDVSEARAVAIADCEGAHAKARADLGPIADVIGHDCSCGAHR